MTTDVDLGVALNADEQLCTEQAVRGVYSSVDGVLEVIACRGETVRAGIREHGTGAYVKCCLAADEWFDELRDRALWGKRVLVEGRVAYDEEGRPLSIVDVTAVIERESGPRIRDFRGSVPKPNRWTVYRGVHCESARRCLSGDASIGTLRFSSPTSQEQKLPA